MECGRVCQGLAETGKVWHRLARCGRVWQGVAKCGRFWQSLARKKTIGTYAIRNIMEFSYRQIGQTIKTWIHTSCESELSHIILVILDNFDTVKCQPKYTFQTMRYEIHYFSVENSGNLNDSDRHIVHLLKLHTKK